MTIEEIKKQLKARKWTQAQLAEKLHMNAKALSGILCGARPLTETLAAHIKLLLAQPRDAVITYRVNIPDERVEEICCDCRTEEERQAAITALIHRNLEELAQLGAIMCLSPEDRKSLGLDYLNHLGNPADDETGSKSQPR